MIWLEGDTGIVMFKVESQDTDSAFVPQDLAI
jgi:hypothetical protein